MKKIFALCLAFLLMFAIAACHADKPGKDGTENTVPTDATEGTPQHTTGTESSAELPSLAMPTVTVTGSVPTVPYSELVYGHREPDFWSDGRLIFLSVQSLLPDIADAIPYCSIGTDTEIQISKLDDAVGMSKIKIYNSQFEFQSETDSLAEVKTLVQTTLAGDWVYLYFTVTVSRPGEELCYGYFIKTTEPQPGSTSENATGTIPWEQASLAAPTVTVTGNVPIVPYSELVYEHREPSFWADGRLILSSVQSVLPYIVNSIPYCNIDADSEIRVIAQDGVDVKMSKIDVYDSRFEFRTETDSLAEAKSLAETTLAEDWVYLYFTVTVSRPGAELCTGYFIKLFKYVPTEDLFADFELSILSADGKEMRPFDFIASINVENSSIVYDPVLVFMSLQKYLKSVEEEIPTIALSENSRLTYRSLSSAKISQSGGFIIYDESFEEIGTSDSLYELWGRLGEWGDSHTHIFVGFWLNVTVEKCGNLGRICVFQVDLT